MGKYYYCKYWVVEAGTVTSVTLVSVGMALVVWVEVSICTPEVSTVGPLFVPTTAADVVEIPVPSGELAATSYSYSKGRVGRLKMGDLLYITAPT
jgi:hypothetical protein